jgi:NAD+ diphosphatase
MAEKFKYCPSCGKDGTLTIDIKKIHCAYCDLTFYKNVAAASACIIETGGKILFVIRNKDPKKGFYDLPGGFVDPGEDAETGINRECYEELSVKPFDLQYMYSFPNIYEYKGFVYNTCDMIFTAKTGNMNSDDFKIDTKEINDVVFVDKKDIDFEKIAFPSIKKALMMYVEKT